MRFLKRKIQLKQDLLNKNKNLKRSFEVKIEDSSAKTESTEPDDYVNVTQKFSLPIRQQKLGCPDGNSKNIIKNYGKALCSFASSSTAIPYLESIQVKNGFSFVSLEGFTSFIKSKRDGMNNIESFRRLLIVSENDDREMFAYKKFFQEISVIFLKYFAVNWIFGGRLIQKDAHLKFRFKMLRRIQDPKHFTYLKTCVKH